MSSSEEPEADVLEQAQPVDEPERPVRPASTPTTDIEAPEADALEQSQEVPAHDEDMR